MQEPLLSRMPPCPRASPYSCRDRRLHSVHTPGRLHYCPAQAEIIIKGGMQIFPSSAYLIIIYSNLLIDVMESTHTGYSQLQLARKCNPNFTERFAIFVREQVRRPRSLGCKTELGSGCPQAPLLHSCCCFAGPAGAHAAVRGCQERREQRRPDVVRRVPAKPQVTCHGTNDLVQ